MVFDSIVDSLVFDWLSLADIGLVTAVIYATLMLIRGTRAVQVLRGFIVLSLIFFVVSNFVPLPALGWLVDRIIPAIIVAIPIIFQPELRRLLEQLGNFGSYLRFFRRRHSEGRSRCGRSRRPRRR